MENKIDDTNKHDTTSDNDKNDIDTLNTPDWLSREWREKNDPPSPPPPKKIYKKKKNYNRLDRKSTRLNSSHRSLSRMPSSA